MLRARQADLRHNYKLGEAAQGNDEATSDWLSRVAKGRSWHEPDSCSMMTATNRDIDACLLCDRGQELTNSKTACLLNCVCVCVSVAGCGIPGYEYFRKLGL